MKSNNKMILLVSHSSLEVTTEYVYEWLLYKGAACQRVNGSDLVRHMEFGISTEKGLTPAAWHSPALDLTQTSAIWIRRWMEDEDFLPTCFDPPILSETTQLQNEGHSMTATDEKDDLLLVGQVNAHLQDEFRALSHYFFELIKDKPTLGYKYYGGKDLNKSRQLVLAQEAGLSVPNTLITDNKMSLQAFKARNKKIITKNIGEINFFKYQGKTSASYTTVLTDEMIERLPSHFYPSLFQQAIEKSYEVRVFYLDGCLYSMAIFSSTDPRTEVDFRRYNYAKPNRTVPIKLPQMIEDRIHVFMGKAGLQTGSIDLICTDSQDYVFLEVNPRGQFGMVSYPCNYYLEKIVAEYLIKLADYGKRTHLEC